MLSFRAVLFRMVPKPWLRRNESRSVLELCCFEWFQNKLIEELENYTVLELCCFEWFQNMTNLIK